MTGFISENKKDLNKNFFSKNDFNPCEKANTFQTHLNNAQIKSNIINQNEIHKGKYEKNDYSVNNPEKNANENNLIEKKRISLNINSPKFTRKSIENDIPTFNPLSNITLQFNKFDRFDPSSTD